MRVSPFAQAILLALIAESVWAADCNTIKDAKLKQQCVSQQAPPAKAAVPPPTPHQAIVVPPVKPAAPQNTSPPKSIVPSSMVPQVPGSAPAPSQKIDKPRAAAKPISVPPPLFNAPAPQKTSRPKGVVPSPMMPIMPRSAPASDPTPTPAQAMVIAPPAFKTPSPAYVKPVCTGNQVLDPLSQQCLDRDINNRPRGMNSNLSNQPTGLPIAPPKAPANAPRPSAVSPSSTTIVCAANQMIVNNQCVPRPPTNVLAPKPSTSTQPAGLPIAPAKAPATAPLTNTVRPTSVSPSSTTIVCAANQMIVNIQCVPRPATNVLAPTPSTFTQPAGLPIAPAKAPTTALPANTVQPNSVSTPTPSKSAQPAEMPIGPSKKPSPVLVASEKVTNFVNSTPKSFISKGESDPNFLNGQCVAWATKVFAQSSSKQLAHTGNAGQIADNAKTEGFQVSKELKSATPGSMVVWKNGAGWGHVAAVVSNDEKNKKIVISEANWAKLNEKGVSSEYGKHTEKTLTYDELQKRGSYALDGVVLPK